MIVAKFGNYERTVHLGDPPSRSLIFRSIIPNSIMSKKQAGYPPPRSVITRFLRDPAISRVGCVAQSVLYTVNIYRADWKHIPERDKSVGSPLTNSVRFALAM